MKKNWLNESRKYSIVLVMFVMISPASGDCQLNDSAATTLKPAIVKPEILSGGFIDIIQNGQMNTSARLFRLFVGEPDRWQLPLSIYSGVSANSFSYSRQNEDLLTNLINPGLGIFNMSLDGMNRLVGRLPKLTSLRFQYQLGLRFLSLYNSFLYRNTTFFNLIGGTGISFVTGAWEREKSNNVGQFWLNFRGLYSNTTSSVLQSFFGQPLSNNMFGYSVGMGIDISQTLAVRAFYFHFLNNLIIDVFREPVLQLSFNYSFR